MAQMLVLGVWTWRTTVTIEEGLRLVGIEEQQTYDMYLGTPDLRIQSILMHQQGQSWR